MNNIAKCRNFTHYSLIASKKFMEDIPLISIIIPVYNVEAFLPQCLDSILAQTFQSWELIVIDDGSVDKSGEICDCYARKDSRIRVVHKANSGQSDSRNIGLSMAKGSLIGFVDSDDWIDEDMYEMLYKAMIENKADISLCSYYIDYVGKSIAVCNEKGVEIYSSSEAVDLILMDKKIKSFPCDKLFRKEMITELFPVSYYYEDYATVFKWMANAKKVVFCREPKYHYRQRQGSTCNDVNPIKYYHFFCAEMQRYEYVVSANFTSEKSYYYARKLLKIGISQSKNIAKYSIDTEEGIAYIRKIREDLTKNNLWSIARLGMFDHFKRMTIMNFPSYFFYEQRMKFRLKFWKKNKQEKLY